VGLGELAALGGALGWAVSALVIKSAAVRVRAVRINAVYVFITVVLGLVVAASSGKLAEAFQIGAMDSGLLLGGAIIGSTGDLALLRSITIGDLGRNFTTATAIFVFTSALGGWLILDEDVGGGAWGGGVLILAGVYLTNVSRDRRPGVPSLANLRGALAAPALALLAGIFWAVSLLMYDEALVDNDVLAANALSHLAPIALYGLIVLFWPAARPLPIPRRDGAILMLSGLIFAASILSLIVAVDQSEASSTAILVSSSPLFIVPLSVAFLGERLTRRSMAGVAITLAGVFLVVGLG
jgi:drug/metabolite transporter (DMT)-like permease